MPDERDPRQDLKERRTRPIGLGISIAVGVFVVALVLFLIYYFLTT